jgi:hypothetical protein
MVSASHIDADAVLTVMTKDMQAASAPAITPFAIVVLSLGSIGWLIEAAITGAVVKFSPRSSRSC